MADGGFGQFGEVFGSIGSSVLNITVLAILGIIVVIAIGGLIYYFLIYRKKFNIDVKIVSERAGDPNIILDKAAILYDRKNKTNFIKILKQKLELDSPRFNILQTSNKGDYLELLRKSEREFVFLTKPRIDREWIIKADGKKYPLANMKHRQLEADYYWLFKRLSEDKGWINPEGLWSKIIQMLPILIPGILMIILFLFFLNALPEILSKLATVIERLGSLEGVATKV